MTKNWRIDPPTPVPVPAPYLLAAPVLVESTVSPAFDSLPLPTAPVHAARPEPAPAAYVPREPEPMPAYTPPAPIPRPEPAGLAAPVIRLPSEPAPESPPVRSSSGGLPSPGSPRSSSGGLPSPGSPLPSPGSPLPSPGSPRRAVPRPPLGETVPLPLWPLVAVNWVADTLFGLLGPPGQLLRSGFGKNMIGVAGIGLLLYTAAHVAQQQGWLSLPMPLPWPR